jgi:hypothetical protein
LQVRFLLVGPTLQITPTLVTSALGVDIRSGSSESLKAAGCFRLRLIRVVASVGLYALIGAACAQPAQPSSACLLVYGQGRNFEADQDQKNLWWDSVNTVFTQQVQLVLVAAGRVSIPMSYKTSETNLPRNLGLLLDAALQQGCNQVLETTFFADLESKTLKARIRLYPLLGLKGPRSVDAQVRIGEPTYTSERNFDWSQRTLARLTPAAVARSMAEEALPYLVR